MGIGRGGAWPPWVLKISARKVVFLFQGVKKQISQLLAPLENIGKLPWRHPLEKILPTPCVKAICI